MRLRETYTTGYDCCAVATACDAINVAFRRTWLSLMSVVLAICLGGCDLDRSEVVVYVALDRQLAEPVLRLFEDNSGVRARVVFDNEASKTTGLVNRLLAEASRPRADLFWNNETSQMTRLTEAGVLHSVKLERHGEQLLGNGAWAGLAARMRVLVANSARLEGLDGPTTVRDLIDPRWRGQAAIANPRYGTTGTHFSALLTLWGEDAFRRWLRDLRANGVAMLPGNAQVKDAVASGRYAFGLTDTDDVNSAILEGKPVRLVIPDQSQDDVGVFLIPNAIALINHGPNPDDARKLFEFLLSSDVERMLAEAAGAQIPLRHDVRGPSLLPPLSSLNVMSVDYDAVGRAYERMLEIVDEEWPH